VSVYGLAGPGGSLPTFLDWIKREADDAQSQHDFFELIVSALREPDLARRIAALYDDYRELVLEMTGVSEPVDPAEGASRKVSDARRRELAAVGSVLVAIEDGIGLQAALDPDFDVEGALAMVQTMVGDALARLKDG
jgi:hypothetical protein